jgi:hypothetical protein
LYGRRENGRIKMSRGGGEPLHTNAARCLL